MTQLLVLTKNPPAPSYTFLIAYGVSKGSIHALKVYSGSC